MRVINNKKINGGLEMVIRGRGLEIDLESFDLPINKMSEEDLRFALQENRLLRKVLTRTRKRLIASNKEIRKALNDR
jgi:hypothetical protein